MNALYRPLLACAASLFAAPLFAGDLALAFVTDTGNDTVIRLQDIDKDGTYNGVGEATTYYDDTIGSIPLGTNNSIAIDEAGVLYVCDATTDIVMGLFDFDGDGDCNEAGEHWVHFDGDPGNNAAGIAMVSSNALFMGESGKLWVTTANNGAGGFDYIFTLQDLNADGDANDAGEAVVYYEPPSNAIGDSIPSDLKIGVDGAAYYLETGSTGFYAKGVYRLVDTNNNGIIDGGTAEASPFFIPTALGATPFYWSITQDTDGSWYMADTGNDLIYRFRDDSADGVITNGSESSTWWTAAPATSLIWTVVAPGDGSLYCNESQSPDRMVRMIDANNDGVIDPLTEVAEIYDEGLSPLNIADPRGLLVILEAEFGTVTCLGDGTGTACPCGNSGGAGEGCANSSGVGATLAVAGSASLAADDLTVVASGLIPGSTSLLFSGTASLNGGNGILFGDGLRCADGNIKRLGIRVPDAMGQAAWGPGLALEGEWNVTDTITIQAWYRDVAGSPCSQAFNTSSGFEFVVEL